MTEERSHPEQARTHYTGTSHPTQSAHARWAAIAREPEKNFEAVSSAMATFAGRAKARDLDELLTLLPTGAHACCSAIESKREFGMIWALFREPTAWSAPLASPAAAPKS